MSSTPYDRQTSFALFSAENPTSQQSGSDLDSEFNAVKIALDDTQQNLAKIQDDDGALKRGSVGQAQFDSSVSLGFAAPQQWASGVLYTANVNTVFYNSIFYIANTTHTSGVSFDASKWDEIADFTAAAAIPDGSITSVKLADGAVAANKLADGVVANSKLATGSVTTNKVADHAITITQIDSQIGPSMAALVLPAGLGPLPWSGVNLPTGWDWADGGVLLPGTSFPALRQRYINDGFPFGQDGSGNPKKPDSRGRTIAGVDGGAGRVSLTTLTSTGLGGSGGAETITLAAAQNGPHSHANSLSDGGHAHGGVVVGASNYNSPGGATVVVQSLIGGNSAAATSNITINNASQGTGSPHANMQPTLICNMIIKAH